MNNFILFFILMGTFFSSSAFAEDALVKRFRDAGLKVMERAEQQGMTSVQGVPLADLKNLMKKADILYSPHVTIRQEGRRCAYWTRTIEDIPANIRLNKECRDISDEELGSLAVHEFLGFGFGLDRHYEVSTEILLGPTPLPDKIKIDVDEHLKIKNTNLKKFLATGGGSTGIGGGGDPHDLRFKMEGLKWLRSLQRSTLFGIPVEFLEIALREMRVRPAANAANIIEFRGPWVEGPQAIAYVNSSFYRGKDLDALPYIAVQIARLYVLYAPYDIGLTSEESRSPIGVSTTMIKVPYLYIRQDKGTEIQWSNPELLKSMSKAEKERALVNAYKESRVLTQDEGSGFQKVLEMTGQFVKVLLR